MIFPKTKTGAEKTISVYWFAILVIVAGAVVYMVVSIYGKPYDVREIEAGLLAKSIADCISEGGYLQENILEDVSFKKNFTEKCGINLETPDFLGTKGEYYIETNLYEFETGKEIDFDILEGNTNLRLSCGLEGKTQPICLNQSFYMIDREQKKYRVDIISIVNKASKNV